jgi:hypothetical protein
MLGKDRWWEKVADAAIVVRWREDVAGWPVPQYSKLEFDWALGEARWLARDAAAHPLARPAPVAGAFETDAAVDTALAAALLAGVRALETAPPHGAKDVHPGSGGAVVDHVHPSLYCYVRGASRVLAGDRAALGAVRIGAGAREDADVDLLADALDARLPPRGRGARQYASARYQWLPAEIDVAADGTAVFASYVNNLHPTTHAPLYRALERLFARCVPLFERALAALRDRPEPYFQPEMSTLYADDEDDDEDDDAFVLPASVETRLGA